MKYSSIQDLFFFSLLTITTAIFFWLLGSYILPVFWALVIAIIFYPLYRWFEKITGYRSSLASLMSIVAVISIVMLPLSIVGGLIVQESIELYQSISEDSDRIEGFSLLDSVEQLVVYLEPLGISQSLVIDRLREGVAQVSQTLASSLLVIGQMTFSFFIYIAVMFYLLFFFFRDGLKFHKTLVYYLPLGSNYSERLFSRFADTARAVVQGTLSIALLQGFLGGLTFWIVGVSNPVLWGFAMAILAIVPAVGPAVVWLPVSLALLFTGSVWEGVTILVVGVLLVSVIDEFLRPILVGRRSKMPDSIILLATVGGLSTFGISGFVIGPIIAAFFLSLWVMFGERYQPELESK